MMHDCEITKEKLIDLIFDELSPASRDLLLAEIKRCENCWQEYQSMSQTMQTVDRVIETATPAESYWPGYESRLRQRLAREAGPGFWRQWRERLAGFPPQPMQMRAVFALLLLAMALGAWMLLRGSNQTSDSPQVAVENPNKVQSSPEPARPVVTPDNIAATPKTEEHKKLALGIGRKPFVPRKNPNVTAPPVESPVEAEIASASATAPTAQSVLTPAAVQHFEKAQMLLRSFRNSNDQDATADLDYERRMSRKLVYQNILLRREAETRGVTPAEEMLGTLEPILLDIANLPEKASRNEVQNIKDRIARQELVAVLNAYASPVLAYNPPQN